MEKREIQFEISLIKSDKWNMVIQLELECNWNKHYRHWQAVVRTIQNNVYMYGKNILKYGKHLKKQTDKMYLDNNK